MTLQSTIGRNDYTAAALQTNFTITFPFLEVSDIDVFVNGVELTTGFTITPASVGGTLTFATGRTLGDRVAIVRDVPLTQELDLERNTRFPAEEVERTFDRVVMQQIDQQGQIDKTIKLSDASPLEGLVLDDPTDSMIGHGVILRQNEMNEFFIGYSEENFDTVVETIQQDVASAATSATNAANSATSASNSATTANNRATAAGNSATAAAGSASNALATEGRITTEGNTQVARVTAEGNTQDARVIAEGNTQDIRVTTEGNTQVARVQAAGSAFIAPTNLSGDELSMSISAQVGLIDETVVRSTPQTYLLPSGDAATMGANELLPTYRNGEFGYEIFALRQNLLRQSDSLFNVLWTKTRCSATGLAGLNTITPSGEADPFLFQTITGAVDGTYTFSVELRAETAHNCQLFFTTVGGTALATEVVPVTTEWTTVALTTPIIGHTSFNSRLDLRQDGGIGIQIRNTQLERASNASPFITTQLSPVTRALTNVTKDVSDTLNTQAGTFVVEYTKTSPEDSRLILSLGSQFSGATYIFSHPTTVGIIGRTTGGVSTAASSIALSGRNRVALSYSETELKCSANGGTVSSAIHTLDSSLWGDLTIGNASWGNSNPFNDAIHSIVYYPRIFTDDELQAESAIGSDNTFRRAVEAITNDIKSNTRDIADSVKELSEVVDHRCIIRGSTTNAPNEIQDVVLGNGDQGSVVANSRYVLTNPFGANTPVIVKAELLVSGIWSDTGWIFDTNGGYGVQANYVQGTGIVVQTGSFRLIAQSSEQGGGHGRTSSLDLTSARARVHVWRVRN